MQSINLEYVSVSWDAVTVQMESCHYVYEADHDPSLIHAYQKRIR